MKPVKALLYYDDEDYSRNRAVGMSYLNRFLIEEDTQSECNGIFECTNARELKNSITNLETNFQRISNESKSDFYGHLVLSGDFCFNGDFSLKYSCLRVPYLHGFPLMITRVGSERLECVQKKLYKKLYKDGGSIKYYLVQGNCPRHKLKGVNKSVGDDVDNFYDCLESGTIYLIAKRTRVESQLRLGSFNDFNILSDSTSFN